MDAEPSRRRRRRGYRLRLADAPERVRRPFFDEVAARVYALPAEPTWCDRDEWVARTAPATHPALSAWLDRRVNEVGESMRDWDDPLGALTRALNSVHRPIVERAARHDRLDAPTLARSLSADTPLLGTVLSAVSQAELDALWASIDGSALPDGSDAGDGGLGLSLPLLLAIRRDPARRDALLDRLEDRVAATGRRRIGSEWDGDDVSGAARDALLLAVLGRRTEGWDMLRNGLLGALPTSLLEGLIRLEETPRDLRVELLGELPLEEGIELFRSRLSLGGEDYAYALLRGCSDGRAYGRLAGAALRSPALFAGLPATKVAEVYAGQRPPDPEGFVEALCGEVVPEESDLAKTHPDFVDALAALDPSRDVWAEALCRLPELPTIALRRFIESDSERVQLLLLGDRRIASNRTLRERLRASGRPAVQEALLRSAEYWDFHELAEELHAEHPSAFLSAMERQTDRTAAEVPREWLRPSLAGDEPELRRRASVQLLRCD